MPKIMKNGIEYGGGGIGGEWIDNTALYSQTFNGETAPEIAYAVPRDCIVFCGLTGGDANTGGTTVGLSKTNNASNVRWITGNYNKFSVMTSFFAPKGSYIGVYVGSSNGKANISVYALD